MILVSILSQMFPPLYPHANSSLKVHCTHKDRSLTVCLANVLRTSHILPHPKFSVTYYCSPQTHAQQFSGQFWYPWPGHLKAPPRIPYVQEVRCKSFFLVPRYSGGKGRYHPLHVPLHKHTLCVPLQELDIQSCLAMLPLPVSSLGNQGLLPKAGCAGATLGGALRLVEH